MEIDLVKTIDFNEKGDERGNLVVVEGLDDIPFDIKRAFYMYNTDNAKIRGQHANRLSEFVLISLSGSCKVKVDNGRGNTKIYSLDNPTTGLYIPKMIWKEMYDFTKDSILLVLSNNHYSENEYIRDYEEYKKEANND